MIVNKKAYKTKGDFMKRVGFDDMLCFVGTSVLTVLGFGVCVCVLIGLVKLFEAAFLQ